MKNLEIRECRVRTFYKPPGDPPDRPYNEDR